MAKIKFLPLVVLLSLLASCGGGASESVESESESEPPVSESESEQDTTQFGLSLALKDGEPLKIAQFADIHFGIEGNDWHNDKVDRTKTYMDYVVETAKPDLIVCSGDNILSTGVTKLKNFINIMEDYETPWTFIYGNHDSESNQTGYSKAELNETLLTSNTEYLLYANEYYETGAENRYGNFSIQLLNEAKDKLLGSLIFFDAGVHTGSEYQAITQGQINWYKTKIDTLQETYAAQSGNAHEVVPTIVFSHIQLQEHATLYGRAVEGDGASFVIEQDLGADAVNSIKDGGPKVNTGLYDVLVEKRSTKAYFVGHAHTYKYQVKDDTHNIVLGFGPQVGFSKLFEDNDLARNCYVYHLNSDFTFTTENVKEDCSNIGLLYSGTYEGKMKVNVETGLYTVQLEFAIWNRIVFSYRGERLSVSDFTKITGYFQNTPNATWGDDLYSSTGDNFIYSGNTGNTYIFEINLEEMTLNIDIWVDPNAPVIPVTDVEVAKINSDAGADLVAVYDIANTKIKSYDESTGASTWSYNGWRYYIIVDPEGRIAYAVQNPPNGYGGPMGTGYYCNSYYEDYLTNPCFNILDGYGPWTPEDSSASKKFEVFLPEGWMLITSHGAGNSKLVSAFSNGEIKDSSDANVNRRGLYLDSLRVTFDADNKLIKASWID